MLEKVEIQSLTAVKKGDHTPFTGDFGKHADIIYNSLVKTDENFYTFESVINNHAHVLELSLKSALRINRRAKAGIFLSGVALGVGYVVYRKVNALELKIEELQKRLDDLDVIEDMDIDLEREVDDAE